MVNRVFLFFVVSLLASCSAPQPDIQVLCETDDVFNYIIKWETYPQLEGAVKIYASNDPEKFDADAMPIATSDISQGVVSVLPIYGLQRQFFKLRFNDKFERIVGTRGQKLARIENFRDIGGYRTDDDRYVRWGQIYRSGKLDQLDSLSTKRLNLFKINTIIDFRSTERFVSSPLKLRNVMNFPVILPSQGAIASKVTSRELKRGDAVIYMQDLNLEMATKAKEAFKSMFNQLMLRDNYPLIITDDYGKDVTGFAIALILYALDIPEEVIMDDYLLSQQYFNKQSVPYDFSEYPVSVQEAVTAMLGVNRQYLGFAIEEIKKQYGSVPNYLDKELGLNEHRRRRLKTILLTE